MTRPQVSPGGLYTLLNSELRKRRVVACDCRMPLPFPVERPDEVSANWRIGTPHECSRGCHALIAEIAAQMWPKYDLLESMPEKSE